MDLASGLAPVPRDLRPLADTWRQSEFLPKQLDDQFYAIAVLRRGHIMGYEQARSNIDPNTRFNSAVEFMPYLPRAFQIGLFAPFPNEWLGIGSMEANTFMRRISAVEMLGIYCGLLFLPFALWRWRRRFELFMVFSVNLLFTLLYAYVIPNIGTLYRMRYGFLMSLVALGIAGATALLLEKVNGQKND